MDVEELAQTYTEEAIDNIAITELYQSLDCTDIRSNSYEITISDDNDDANEMESVVVEFDKFMTEWAPFINTDSSTTNTKVAEGAEPPKSIPDNVAVGIAEYIYDLLQDGSGEARYHDTDINGLRGLLKTYREYVGREPETIVVDDELLDDGVAVGLEEIEDVQIYESEFLDLGDEILIANDALGYYATRTPPEAQGYFSTSFHEDNVASRDDPYIVTCYTRVEAVTINPSYTLRCKPFDRNVQI